MFIKCLVKLAYLENNITDSEETKFLHKKKVAATNVLDILDNHSFLLRMLKM